jgi:VWFA-related protein
VFFHWSSLDLRSTTVLFFVDDDPLGLTEIGNLYVIQLKIEAFANGFATVNLAMSYSRFGFVDENKRSSCTIRALQAISQSTGGTAYFPKDLSKVDAITKSIGSDIRDRYVIGYKSSNPMAGHGYHVIDVQASDASRHRLRVRTRTGYYSETPALSQKGGSRQP